MKNFAKSALAIVGGFIIGSIVNMGIIVVGPKLVPPPEGADTSTMEGLTAAMSLFEPKHSLAPFLAHALGTLVGAFVAAKLNPAQGRTMAFTIGVLFLLGGLTNVFILPSPLWFSAIDILFAYLPMAWLASKFANSK